MNDDETEVMFVAPKWISKSLRLLKSVTVTAI